jgi:hypothetical protein
MRNLSNWRSVRLWEHGVERELRTRHRLWLHGWCIGLVVLGTMWAVAHLQMLMGAESLALRYLATLGVGYLAYLLVLRLWAAALLGRDDSHFDLPLDQLPMPGGRPVDASTVAPDLAELPAFRSGGGGDFGGGGATADFPADAEGSEAIGDVAKGAFEVAAGADEGIVVVVPVVAVFLIGLAVIFGAGSLMLLYFGFDALLTVAVELAFGYVSARTAIRVVREGWLSAVIRLTWKPLLGALLCAVLLGATIDYFIPAATSLPHAIRLIMSSP